MSIEIIRSHYFLVGLRYAGGNIGVFREHHEGVILPQLKRGVVIFTPFPLKGFHTAL